MQNLQILTVLNFDGFKRFLKTILFSALEFF